MAGHSHSSNIRFRKDRVDSKRAKTFSKLSRMITVAAKEGGGSPDANAKLRLALDKARVLSMPKEGIERAIKKGTGEGNLGDFEEIVYEGYGPGGVAVMMEILTDNRNRSAADVRMIMEKCGGNLGQNGAVNWMFERRGRWVVPKERADGDDWTEETLMDVVIEAGADDLTDDGDAFVVLSEPGVFAAVNEALSNAGLTFREAGLASVPTQRTTVTELAVAEKLIKMIDGLEDNDDVQEIFTNEEFSDDVLKALEGGA
ncbi:MAG: YebC/PmpR family DNA-binding transcriptional regulator [Planctomycetes bacterium]|nr:YebC/PmpR family DNA-binding transcriptional regulator [Planctomycetota bacterium]